MLFFKQSFVDDLIAPKRKETPLMKPNHMKMTWNYSKWAENEGIEIAGRKLLPTSMLYASIKFIKNSAWTAIVWCDKKKQMKQDAAKLVAGSA